MPEIAPRAPARLIAFFLAEAAGYVTTLREELWLSAAERDTGKFLAATRGLRGTAAMAQLTDLAVLAGRIERIARAIHLRRAQWSDALSYSLQAVGYELPDLIAAAPRWSAADSERASAIATALQAFAPPADSGFGESVLPIARLFHEDSGPHVIYAAVTPQTQFEQQLREPMPDRSASNVTSVPSAAGRPGARKQPEEPTQRQRSPSPTPGEQRPRRPAKMDRATLSSTDGPQSTPARGHQLRGLLARSLESFEGLEETLDERGVPAPLPPSYDEEDSPTGDSRNAGPVPIESLLYRGRAALDRARAIRAAHASAGTEPSGSELDELMDLVELATEL